MPELLLYYAHPGHRFSHVNAALWREAEGIDGITRVDLYATYPRFTIDVDREQARLRAADVIVFQYPLFWYATPSLLKEWIDLVLEHGFAYGHGGDALAGKALMVAISAAGPEEAYTPNGYQHFDLRTFLCPMEQTARLCQMTFLPPYVLHGALRAPKDGRLDAHVAGYGRLLTALRDGQLTAADLVGQPVVTAQTLPLAEEA